MRYVYDACFFISGGAFTLSLLMALALKQEKKRRGLRVRCSFCAGLYDDESDYAAHFMSGECNARSRRAVRRLEG